MRKYFRGGIAAVTGVLAATSIVLTPAATAAPAQDPDTAKLAGALATQSVKWEECTFPGVAEETVKKFKTVKGLACATIQVPRD